MSTLDPLGEVSGVRQGWLIKARGDCSLVHARIEFWPFDALAAHAAKQFFGDRVRLLPPLQISIKRINAGLFRVVASVARAVKEHCNSWKERSSEDTTRGVGILDRRLTLTPWETTRGRDRSESRIETIDGLTA